MDCTPGSAQSVNGMSRNGASMNSTLRNNLSMNTTSGSAIDECPFAISGIE